MTLRLELAKGIWHPESDNGEAIPVYAFGERGKPLQVPGPTVRVPEGTMIDISLHSNLTVAATLHGLHQRPGKVEDIVDVPPGGTKHLRFVAGAPGTYLYWARTLDGKRGNNRVLDALLGGALVIDAVGASGDDRIFVLERWNGPSRTAINGKSWPYTERLNYQVGERVHWRVINASDLSHPMHLHGFHFELDAEGDGEHYNVYGPDLRPLEFTHSVEIGETIEMTWTPTEPGRWLYHCHRTQHIKLPVPLASEDALVSDPHEHMHDMSSEYDGMGGMIIGITVTGPSAVDTVKSWKPARKLELTVGSRNGDPRFHQLLLRDLSPGATSQNPETSTGLAGPVIVLNQNQPTEIAVINQLNEPTSIHWHGIELESYYDGVPGWGGIGDQKTPAVDPGQRFTVRMTPQRSGTFIYHSHWHDESQLTGGIHGMLIVMPKGQIYNSTIDKSFVISQSSNEPFGAPMILLNGVPQPESMELVTGTAYRFRFVNITPSISNVRVSLRKDGSPLEWRVLAKDAVEVRGTPKRAADQMISIGETYDFEYRATSPGEVRVEALPPNDTRGVVEKLIFVDRQKLE